MHDYIYQVMVPKEKQLVFKKNEPIEEERKLFPGYVIVNMMVTDESWYVVRNTPNVTGFIGSGTIPVPVSDDEIKRIRKRMGMKEPKFKANFTIGEVVSITEGPFAGYQ